MIVLNEDERFGTVFHFFKQSGCVGCHHQPITSFAVSAARTAGFQVDAAAAKEQLDHMRFGMKEFTVGIEGEANRRMGILCLLYKQRRADPEAPGCSVLDLENVMTIPREHLMFTLWYLKEKDWKREQGRLLRQHG